MFTWLVGGFIVLSLIGIKIVRDAQAEDRRRPKPRKRSQY